MAGSGTDATVGFGASISGELTFPAPDGQDRAYSAGIGQPVGNADCNQIDWYGNSPVTSDPVTSNLCHQLRDTLADTRVHERTV